MAYVCGIFPLVTGVGIFLTWCLTGNGFLEMLGLFTIMGGSLPRRGREGWGTTAMVVVLPNGQVKAYRSTLPWYRDDSD